MELATPARVLVVVPGAQSAGRLARALSVHCEPRTAADVAQALDELDRVDYDVVLLSTDLAEAASGRVLHRLAALGRPTQVMLVVEAAGAAPASLAHLPALAADQWQSAGAWVGQAAALSRLRREHRALRARTAAEEGGGVLLLSEDAAMRDVLARVEAMAALSMPVLIEGEVGTGKEGLARRLHQRGPRSEGPFVVLRCGDAPESLDRRLESGHGGVAYLEDVDSLPEPAQERLRALLEAGAAQGRPARVVAASCRDLAGEAREGRFHPEVAQHLVAQRVQLPALRERRGDIPLLATHFLSRATGGRRSLSADALRALAAYPWPGNVRELRMVVERAGLIARGPMVEPGDLRLDVDMAAWPTSAAREGLSLDEVQKRYIEAVLADNGGHRGRSARALGIDPKTLYNRLGPTRLRRRRDS